MMRLASSLTNRIFIASTVLATLSLGFAFYFVNARATAEAEAELRRGLTESATLVDQRRENLTETLTTMARLVADLPKLKAAVETGDAPTVQPLVDEYRATIASDVLMLTDPRGTVLGASGSDVRSIPIPRNLSDSFDRELGLRDARRAGCCRWSACPSCWASIRRKPSGGSPSASSWTTRWRRDSSRSPAVTIVFAAGDAVLASSLPRQSAAVLARMTDIDGIASVTIDAEEFLILARPMRSGPSVDAAASAPVTLVLRSRTRSSRIPEHHSRRSGRRPDRDGAPGDAPQLRWSHGR